VSRLDVRFGVISRHCQHAASCPLYPQKRTSICTQGILESARKGLHPAVAAGALFFSCRSLTYIAEAKD
jgi:hypothetical protein